MRLTKNEHTDFVGLNALKVKQASQLALFEEWARTHEWMQFHTSHYDWWMFPFSKRSQFGFAYVIYETEIRELKKDPAFVSNYLRGVELLLLSWGWDLHKEAAIPEPDYDQSWQNWPIRLYKCAVSLQEFGYVAEFNSVRNYARFLLKQGVSFQYNGKDLSTIFE